MKKRLVLTLALLACGPVSGTGGPACVMDGDSFKLHGEEIRLWGIDAPELTQLCERPHAAGTETYRCGGQARFSLDVLINTAADFGGTLTCTPVGGKDRYGRTVARCSIFGEDLGRQMIESGWALDNPRYSGGAYTAHERTAREARRGLWEGTFTTPWDRQRSIA